MVYYSERGFARYDDIETSYGDTVHVYESSSAEGSFVWLSIKGEAHLFEAPRPLFPFEHGIAYGRMSAHMNRDQAIQVIAALTEWLEDKS